MRKALLMVVATFGSIALMNCSSDDNKDSKQDCFNCSEMGGVTTKFCYTEGDNFYTLTAAGQSQKIPLQGATWEDVKKTLKEACN